MNPFLKEILGKDGYSAINRAMEKLPALKSVIIPRAIYSWVETQGKLGYEGGIPTLDISYLSLSKNENGRLDGAILIDNVMYTFQDSDPLHITASVGVALNLDVEPIDESLKSKDLTMLGKSIDLLVKTEIVKRKKKELEESEESSSSSEESSELEKGKEAMVGAPGPANEPRIDEPDKPKTPRRQGSYNPRGTHVQEPNIAPQQGRDISKFKLKITKSESKRTCLECGLHMFERDTFVGCACLRDLSKSVKTEKYQDFFLLKSKALDEEAASLIIEYLKE